ncbi:hypothetical protein B6N60_00772 [Richelia sinica FACHB-800]|uniref:Uncharacterized protein n=1 Tax=Richelia sinica FACHB-800 TaxID=1357546 RepID=A0A975Y3H1_9NOST|nr:hypothetical protein B6N60_00772 [Richelia sinica FACHB-800]
MSGGGVSGVQKYAFGTLREQEFQKEEKKEINSSSSVTCHL